MLDGEIYSNHINIFLLIKEDDDTRALAPLNFHTHVTLTAAVITLLFTPLIHETRGVKTLHKKK